MPQAIKPPALFPWQQEVFDSKARFKVLAIGRRAGKTAYGVIECINCAFNQGRAWWTAPTFPTSLIGWREMKKLVHQINRAAKLQTGFDVITIKESEKLLSFQGGGFIQCKTADNPDRLRGEGLDLAVLDEAAYTKEEAWTDAIRPALSDRKGRAILMSSPNGKNWFFDSYMMGLSEDEDYSSWESWQLPSSVNPFLDPKEIEEARKTLVDAKFKQEYLAEFLDGNYAVFRNISDCIDESIRNSPYQQKEVNGTYVFGVDWGKKHDFTVITVIDVLTQSVVHIERFNKIDYAIQRDKLKALHEHYKPVRVIVEQNSIGEVLIEELRRDGLKIEAFNTTASSKTNIIEALALAFERQDITILNHKELIHELNVFTAFQNQTTGYTRYSAPTGHHDDCVMSLAIAWTAIHKPRAQWGTFDRSLVGI
jgi:phage FluMu gp28-like protein